MKLRSEKDEQNENGATEREAETTGRSSSSSVVQGPSRIRLFKEDPEGKEVEPSSRLTVVPNSLRRSPSAFHSSVL